jgi:hypothetical protein
MGLDIGNSIRSKIATGLLPLPKDAPGKVWVGPGTGKVCDACDEPVTDKDREYEIDLPDRTLRFHSDCIAAWHQQRIEGQSGNP